MSSFYTNAVVWGNQVLLRGVDNGQRYKTKVPYKPYLFVNSKNEKTEFTTLDLKPVEKIEFDSISEARDFVKRYKDVANMPIYGMTSFVYPFLIDTFPDEVEFDKDHINVLNIDIEVESDTGFPDVNKAEKRVTAICMKVRDRIEVLGCGDYKKSDSRVNYTKCANETHLLEVFVKLWKELDPDIITGWYVEFFDIPYIVNRIKKVLGDDFAKKLSPWGVLTDRTVEIMGKENQTYCPLGIAILDYQQLYKKYTYNQQENYRLDYICSQEIGEGKIDYSEFGNLYTLYKDDYQKFIDYNINDVLLVDKLEEKLGFLNLAMIIAYDARANFEDVFTMVRLWDAIIHNYLIQHGMVIPQKTSTSKTAQFVGAYVKEPHVGMHNFVVSFDLTALYPSLMVQYNMSPEMYAGKIRQNYTVDQVLAGAFLDDDIPEFLRKNNYALTANSCLWDKNRKGFFPILIEKLMTERKLYKKKMNDAKRENEKNPSKRLEDTIAKYDGMQMARKIQLNSLYGILGNQYSRWYQLDFAEAITITGQVTIQWVQNKLNVYLNKVLKTTDVDYVIAADTDSNYLNLGPLVDAVLPNGDIEKKIDFIDRVCKEKLQPYINKCFDELAEYTNAYCNFMDMKREVIADKGIWTAKKRYILNVHDSEGVRYATPKLKIMGLETQKSSTPAKCRESIKKVFKMIMETDEPTVQKFLADYRTEFSKYRFEEVAFPRGCKNLEEYSSRTDIYKKGTPIHVRGALLYNSLITKYGLANKYPTIKEGEKIKFCYLKMPNPLHENVLAVPNILPPEFALERYVDHDLQYQKAFLDPVKAILDVIGWTVEKENTLEAFFG